MAAEDGSSEPGDRDQLQRPTERARRPSNPESTAEDSEDQETDGEEEEEESRLKYATLTRNVSSLYRNGDATSSFHVVGDKMIVGTHNGNIHVFTLPSFSSLRVYSAHTASISAISVSPFNPPLAGIRSEQANRVIPEAPSATDRSPTSSPASKGKPTQPAVPDTPANRIYIATSSIDGNVCIASLVDPRDVQLRNFGRPIQAVALSPEYKSDRAYLSGGQAGGLVLTIGGQVGRSANATTTGAAAAASGWLGSIGLGANTGSDKILHSGEGIISTIKWSLSGRYVLWVNEQGIKIMRSNLRLESHESGHEWKRLSHIDRPNRPGWEDMAGVWKARVEWINRDNLESEDDSILPALISANGSAPNDDSRKTAIEEVLVGWGDSAWLIKVLPGSKDAGSDNKIGSAEIMTM
jgi:vacuolar protein sorting-associated protein 41